MTESELEIVSIRAGALYGVLAFAGLIALHLTLTHSVVGAVLAVVGSGAAYANFTVLTANPRSAMVTVFMVLSIGMGVASGLLAIL